ncbi:hypothetical protein A6A08_10110 [Nocardiopsis sp. TSRI0078]|uniref:hypothetical protein n=1 Tax=unclassified Nocardiopsis TaxID=2649073 RepID=UPI00093B9A44|nr:hypothetical protein [Nocardiopsis sp. TSRI0078]OKI15891.1 hypothetical protein A6A08_10110 [Nocardiopsis sp. TSRI0078]
MTENTDRNGGAGEGRNPDLVDDALKLVDSLQRKLLAAGVRRGVSAVTSPPPSKGDVWEEAIRMESDQRRPALDEVLDIVRTSAPEVAGHLGRAGVALAGALGRTWDVVERSLEQTRADAAAQRGSAGEPEPGRGGAADGTDRQVTAGE